MGLNDISDNYKELFPGIYSYIRCRVENAESAEDLTAEVFKKALQKRATYNSCKGNMSQWLFGIARNEVNLSYRKKALRRVVSLDFIFGPELRDPAPGPQDGAEESEERRRLMRALAKTDSRERDLIALKFYSNMTNREISSLTGLSETNVGSILHRTMTKLRTELRGSDL